MDDAAPVCGREGIGDLSAQFCRRAPGERTTGQHRPEALTLEQLHDRDRLPFHLRQLVDRQNAGMRQGSYGAGLVLEPRAHRGIAGEVVGEHLDGHVAAEPGIVRAIHVTHAAGTQRLDDFVLQQANARR